MGWSGDGKQNILMEGPYNCKNSIKLARFGALISTVLITSTFSISSQSLNIKALTHHSE